MSKESTSTFQVYALLTCLCCLTHFMTHMGAAQFHTLSWWLVVAIILAACWTLQQFSLQRFFLLIGLQMTHTIVDAPFNPDHWLLLFFVNSTISIAAIDMWLRGQSVTEHQLYSRFAPAGRLLFLICYGYAALSKLNSHFLIAESSCASELAKIQVAVSPWLQAVSVPAIAGWMTVLCESAVPLLLIPRRTRRFGIVIGVVFHTILVLSPAIAVFDFTMMVYTMLFLFAGDDVGEKLFELRAKFRASAPAVADLLMKSKTWILLGIAWFMISRSALGYALYGSPRVSRLNWLVNMLLASVVIALTLATLFGKRAGPSPQAKLRPQLAWHVVVLALALFNGACPYLGLKTQGSFTMFSNLRTEAGHWNHLLVPSFVRVFGQYQDDLVQVAKVDDKRLQTDYVNRDCLVPRFEVQRAAMRNPNMSITVVRNGEQMKLDPVSVDAELGEPVGWLAQKLMIFRPVTPDGSPYCGN